jgi:hypothetical protein
MRGGWATLRVTIIAAVVTFAKLANTRSVNHLECKVFIILKVVEDHGTGDTTSFPATCSLRNGLCGSRKLKRWEDFCVCAGVRPFHAHPSHVAAPAG